MNQPQHTNNEPRGGIFYLILLLALVSGVYFVTDLESKAARRINYLDLQRLVTDGKVIGELEVSETLIKGQYLEVVDPASLKVNVKEAETGAEEEVKNPLVADLIKRNNTPTSYPVPFFVKINLKIDNEPINFLKENKIPYVYLEEKETSIISTLLTMLVLFFVVSFLVRLIFGNKGGSSGSGLGSGFGMRSLGVNDSHFRVVNPEDIKVSFQDVQGIDEVKSEVQEIIEFIAKPEKFEKVGATVPHGVLLYGEPGTGKTMLAKAIAKESGSSFISISGSEFVEMFVGLGAQRVRKLFSTARQLAIKSQRTCIIFIDEIDAVGGKRGANNMSGGHSEQEQTLNQLLTEMDGFSTQEGHVVVIAATNRSEMLDPALKRAGRFDREITVPLPDVKGRQEILKVHTAKIPLAENVSLEKIARGTAGFSGAKLAALANEAAIHAARESRVEVEHRDFESAKDKILMGIEQRSLVQSEEEKLKTARHEAGHAFLNVVAGKLLDPLHKVSIVPRGHALGVTMSLPEKEKALNYSKAKCDFLISMMMGGRIAEEVFYNGELTTGASNDIEKATELARGMVYAWGMSKLGPINFANDSQFNYKFSEQTRAEADTEVRNIVMANYNIARELISKYKEVVDEIAQLLMQKETIDGSEVEEIVTRAQVPVHAE